jgi:CheY-like chemotaxis protein
LVLTTDKHQHDGSALSAVTGLSAVPRLALPVSSQEVKQQLRVSTRPAPRRFSLLIVDDNETNQAFLQAVLALYPFTLAAEYTGQAALERCSQQQFDLILMDIQLPDMSGIEVTQQLRKRPEFQKTTILAFTAHALPEEIERFKQAGMNDVVIKPLDSKKVTTLLRWCQLQPDEGAAGPSR